MSKRSNKICHTCSTKYNFCTGCAEYDHLPRWMALFHNDNCRNIFNIISSYNVGHVSKEDALCQLKDCDLSYKNNIKENIIRKIDEIFEIENVVDNEITDIQYNETTIEEFVAELIEQPTINVVESNNEITEEVFLKRKPAKMKYKKQIDEDI